MHVLTYDSAFHFAAASENAFTLPSFCRFSLVSSLWLEILFTDALHFNTFKKLFMRVSIPRVCVSMVHRPQLAMEEEKAAEIWRGAGEMQASAKIFGAVCPVPTSSPAA